MIDVSGVDGAEMYVSWCTMFADCLHQKRTYMLGGIKNEFDSRAIKCLLPFLRIYKLFYFHINLNQQ